MDKPVQEAIRDQGLCVNVVQHLRRGEQEGAVNLFTRAALKGETAVVYGNGSHVRDYFYVGDVVRVIKMIVNGELKPGVYECGTGGRVCWS